MEDKNAASPMRKFFIRLHHSGFLLLTQVLKRLTRVIFFLYIQNYDVCEILLFKKTFHPASYEG